MIKHYIIMSSSYTDGGRIALDITDKLSLNSKAIENIIHELRDNCGKDVPLSSHLIETASDSWDSVKEYDPFFDGVICTKSVSDFSEKIKTGRVLSGLDVATYILSKLKCTHLSLEKLVYFAYADYLCNYSDRLFEDKIYAFKLGPVVESVYETFKRSGYKCIESLEQDSGIGLRAGIDELPVKSRILFTKNGTEKLRSIDQTIKNYGECSASALVDFTHRKGSPWSKVDSSKEYSIISDDLISKYHYIECI